MLGRLRLGKRWSLFAVVALVVFGGSAVAYATIPGSDRAIHACYQKGALRLIDKDAGQKCSGGETEILFAAAASLACPTGTLMFAGVCVETAQRPAATLPAARRTCVATGRRLPTAPELFGFRELPGVTLPSAEWADDLGDVTLKSTFVYVAMDDRNDGIHEAFSPLRYRCVTGPGLR
jgi:hypothetical protein